MAFVNQTRQELLLPAKGSFIIFSLFFALVLNLLPLKGMALILWPDFVALVILYWCINQPQHAGISMAFGMGLLMDIGDASALGQNALAYSMMAFLGLMFQRRLSVFGPVKQAPQIGLILFAGQLVLLFAGLLSGSHFPGWDFFLMTIIGMFLWPLVSSLLRTPRKPRSDSDAG